MNLKPIHKKQQTKFTIINNLKLLDMELLNKKTTKMSDNKTLITYDNCPFGILNENDDKFSIVIGRQLASTRVYDKLSNAEIRIKLLDMELLTSLIFRVIDIYEYQKEQSNKAATEAQKELNEQHEGIKNNQEIKPNKEFTKQTIIM